MGAASLGLLGLCSRPDRNGRAGPRSFRSPGNIVVCDRTRAQLNNISGWLPTWVRQASASWDWSPDQTEIAGYNPGHDPRVSGYNPGYYVDCPGYLLPWQSPANPSHTRSYVA